MIDNESLFSLLKKHSQSHLEESIAVLTDSKKNELYNFLETLSCENQITKKECKIDSPLLNCFEPSEEDFLKGQDLISKGKVGVIVLAAGDGTRLGFSRPKGMFPISVIKKKTLFQIFCEKIIAAQKKYNRTIFCAMMISPKTKNEVLEYFEKNKFFGLKKNQFFFFLQPMLPLFDENGKWVFEKKGKIAFGPSGNGEVFHSFYSSGLLSVFSELGIDICNVVSIDNPIADPVHCGLVGFHGGNDVTIVAIKRDEILGNTGVLITNKTNVLVKEYTEIKDNERYPFVNTGLYSVSLSFFKKVYKKRLPEHHIQKKGIIFCDNKFISKKLFRKEKFIFDSFVYAKKSQAILLKKEDCFSPLKNKRGKDSVQSVQQDLLKKDQKIFLSIAGKEVKNKIFELPMDFHYPTKDLIDKCKRKDLSIKFFIEGDLV
jgi:UDP-N-acetylglucosamine/UDP-N-acetylgalactosamine diphosphorylase